MGTLRNLTEEMEAAINNSHGDVITYTPDGGSPVTFDTWVEFDADQVGMGSAAELLVEVLRSRVPAPSRADRITIAIRPGVIYAPADVRQGATGATWRLPLKKVAS